MEADEFQTKGKEVLDYMVSYLKNIRDKNVFPNVKPGYLKELLPGDAPLEGEKWEEIFSDFEKFIMPGVMHFQSPFMNGYYPALNSYPSILAEMITSAINSHAFTWATCPAATELEQVVLDWLVRALDLPRKFLYSNKEPFGGGCIEPSVSETTYYALMSARQRIFNRSGASETEKYAERSEINGKLVCYTSDQAHASVEKAAKVGLVRIRHLSTDDSYSLRGETLQRAIDEDRKSGLIPFLVISTLGTTGTCASDNLDEIGPICKEESLWLHIDAAYSGSAYVCPELREYTQSLEYANSFAFNAAKWLLVNIDCTCFWVDDSRELEQALTVMPIYLKKDSGAHTSNYINWQLSQSRRFKALKLWFVLRSYGIEGLRDHIRKAIRFAKLFESYLITDERFELTAKTNMGLVVFKIKGDNEFNKRFLAELNKDGTLLMVPCFTKGMYMLRYSVNSYNSTEQDIETAWNKIKETADKFMLNN